MTPAGAGATARATTSTTVMDYLRQLATSNSNENVRGNDDYLKQQVSSNEDVATTSSRMYKCHHENHGMFLKHA